MKTVLVIEDEKPMANIWKVKFSHAGYDVHIAYDGTDGMAQMSKARYDVILLDINLPGMSGLQILGEKGKTPNADTPVYVITNSFDTDDLDRAKTLGATETFLKYQTTTSDILQVVQGAVGA